MAQAGNRRCPTLPRTLTDIASESSVRSRPSSQGNCSRVCVAEEFCFLPSSRPSLWPRPLSHDGSLGGPSAFVSPMGLFSFSTRFLEWCEVISYWFPVPKERLDRDVVRRRRAPRGVEVVRRHQQRLLDALVQRSERPSDTHEREPSIARISRGRSRSRLLATDHTPLLNSTFGPRASASIYLNELPKLRTRVRFSSPALRRIPRSSTFRAACAFVVQGRVGPRDPNVTLGSRRGPPNGQVCGEPGDRSLERLRVVQLP